MVAIVAPRITCGVSSTVHYDILASDSMSNILIAILLALASQFFYLFFLWKYLREDFDISMIFSFGFLTYIGLIVGLIIGGLLTMFWYWVALGVFFIVYFLLFRKSEFKIYELIESSAPGLIFFHTMLYLYGVTVQSLALIPFIGTMLILVLFFVLKRNYKKFTWYESGKLGFASMASLGILFLVRAVISLLPITIFSFNRVVEFIPAAILSFICFFSLYNLSER